MPKGIRFTEEQKNDFINKIIECRLRKQKMYYHNCKTCNKEYATKGKTSKGVCTKCVANRPERREKISKNWVNKTNEEINAITKRREASCLEKYGSKNPLQVPEIKEKVKKYWKDNYGVVNSFQADFVKNKIKNHWVDNYGVTNASHVEYIRQKISTSLKNSDFDRVGFMHDRIKKMDEDGIERVGAVEKQKAQQTNLKKYGHVYFFGSEIGKMSKTNLMHNYGWNEEQYSELRSKKAQTLENFIKRYGDEGEQKYEKYKKSTSQTLENMIRRFGEKEGRQKYEQYIQKRAQHRHLFAASKESLKFFIPLYKKNT